MGKSFSLGAGKRALPWAAAIVAAQLAAAPVALAGTCFQVIDRSGAVRYQSPVTPVDLQGPPDSPALKALRSRGEHVVVFSAPRCAHVVAEAKNAPRTPASMTDILADVPDVVPSRGAGVAGAYARAGSGGTAADDGLARVHSLAHQASMPGHYGDAATVVPRIR